MKLFYQQKIQLSCTKKCNAATMQGYKLLPAYNKFLGQLKYMQKLLNWFFYTAWAVSGFSLLYLLT